MAKRKRTKGQRTNPTKNRGWNQIKKNYNTKPEWNLKKKVLNVRTVPKSNWKFVETKPKSIPLIFLVWYSGMTSSLTDPNFPSVKLCGHANDFRMWVKCFSDICHNQECCYKERPIILLHPISQTVSWAKILLPFRKTANSSDDQ